MRRHTFLMLGLLMTSFFFVRERASASHFGLFFNIFKRSIAQNGTTRNWSDGTYANSCNNYRNPSNNSAYRYAGATGDGTYRIKPSGVVTPFDVQCDMTNNDGGWTMVYKTKPGINYYDDWTSGNVTDSTTSTAYTTIPILSTSSIMFHGDQTYDPTSAAQISTSPLIYVFNGCTAMGSGRTMAGLMSGGNNGGIWASYCSLDTSKLPANDPGFYIPTHVPYSQLLYFNLSGGGGICTFGETRFTMFPGARTNNCGGTCGYELSGGVYQQSHESNCNGNGTIDYSSTSNAHPISLYVR
jgi:hypothetical protein